MERAGKYLTSLKLTGKISTDELARAAWTVAVGKRIALHATATSLVRDRLVIEVEDAIWQQQLFHLRHQILKKLRDVVGDDLVHDLEFRIAPLRRPPQMAEKPVPSGDEADGIQDPGLRIVYREARKKASA